MKRYLLPLIAALALPTAASAESVWLVLRYLSGVSFRAGAAIEKIEMRDMEQCELMGAKWMGAKETGTEKRRDRVFAYTCIEGK